MSEIPELMAWQQEFIAKNLLEIGYNAWAGYLGSERGAIICSTNSPKVSIAGESFRTHFTQRSCLAAFLNAWLAVPDTVILRHHFITAQLVKRLQSLVQQQEIYRIKGFVAVPNKATRLVIQGVGNRFDTFYDRPWQPDEPRQTRLVFIRRLLQQSQISLALLANSPSWLKQSHEPPVLL
ncbi:GTP-binding protein [Leptothermofonsia sp. ETS-13]|uniref:GTP-binding protein n=1 Tax=Leptothermofonsia sp. ETS-13 TaxID=3035696 RepID=UPI003BA040E8